MSTITRTLSNLRKVGIKDYFRQMLYIGDTKAGRLVGTDRAGNKFYEDMDELPLRTRWVDYKKHAEDPLIRAGLRKFEKPHPIPNYTATRGAFVTYNTTKPKVRTWEPKAIARQ
ncbi:hypothetical protein BN1708_004699 [Verticillium longisporum]|uniref:NADH dehydrogenase [ubiquinone] 1 alpha subcomplex subunit n=1 Tax=Verticillium longisporum TaxID=100787 RepID=A0A0G4M386_VERLO|nr:hypothetical protein BN1708_004699 [Verticillium longisporum]